MRALAGMGELKSFLESSTIHGLSYISTTRKHVRIIWTAIVITGFITASILIEEFFQTWTDNPISTTIETRPISEVKFPKVTVCPPKDSFTDLNDVLVKIGNKTFDYDLTNESNSIYQVLEKFTTFFQNEDFKKRVSNLNSFTEHDRYRNWYQSKSNANFPAGNELSIETSSPFGEIKSPFFKEDIDLDKFDKIALYYVQILSPYYEDVTLNLKIEYETLENYECLRILGYRSGTISNCLQTERNSTEIQWTKFRKTTIMFKRVADMSTTSIKEVFNLKQVTGFRLSWKFSTNATYKPRYKIPNRVFIGISNLLNERKDIQMEILWKVVREVFNLNLLQ